MQRSSIQWFLAPAVALLLTGVLALQADSAGATPPVLTEEVAAGATMHQDDEGAQAAHVAPDEMLASAPHLESDEPLAHRRHHCGMGLIALYFLGGFAGLGIAGLVVCFGLGYRSGRRKASRRTTL